MAVRPMRRISPDQLNGRDYLRNTPNFETASGKYDWLNRIVAVGVGRRRSDHAAYEVFQIL